MSKKLWEEHRQKYPPSEEILRQESMEVQQKELSLHEKIKQSFINQVTNENSNNRKL